MAGGVHPACGRGGRIKKTTSFPHAKNTQETLASEYAEQKVPEKAARRDTSIKSKITTKKMEILQCMKEREKRERDKQRKGQRKKKRKEKSRKKFKRQNLESGRRGEER